MKFHPSRHTGQGVFLGGGLKAQLKAEKLGVPSTAKGFRAAVSALRSLDGGRV
jgi:hypothetical protein